MRGFAVKYIFYTFIVVFFVVLGISIFTHFAKTPEPQQTIINVTYDCLDLNNTFITSEEFEQVLYGFLTDQCTSFHAGLLQRITFEDIERYVAGVDSYINVFKSSECTQLQAGTNSVFVNFDEAYSGITITRRSTEDSNVIICEAAFNPTTTTSTSSSSTSTYSTSSSTTSVPTTSSTSTTTVPKPPTGPTVVCPNPQGGCTARATATTSYNPTTGNLWWNLEYENFNDINWQLYTDTGFYFTAAYGGNMNGNCPMTEVRDIQPGYGDPPAPEIPSAYLPKGSTVTVTFDLRSSKSDGCNGDQSWAIINLPVDIPT